jgi:hypothetical protein
MCEIADCLRAAERLINRAANVAAAPAGPTQIAATVDDIVLTVDDLLNIRAEIARRLEDRTALGIGTEARLVDQGQMVDRQLRALNRAEARLVAALVQTHRGRFAALSPLF